MDTAGWRRERWADAALVLALTPVMVIDALLAAGRRGAPPALLDSALPLDVLLPVAAAAALLARRRFPRAVLSVTVLCVLGYSVAAGPSPLVALPVLIALYTVTDVGYRPLAVATAGLLAAGAVAANLIADSGAPPRERIQQAILPVGWFVATVVLGELARHRRAYLHQLEQRAVQAERTKEEAARQRAARERLRIARELHDSLTHSISVIKVQAGVAVHLARKRGEQPPRALLAIEEASGDAIRELRATLHVLRGDEPPDAGLARLPELLARARATGQMVRVRTTGTQRPLPAAVDRAAYRIIQEALTNIARHAGPTPASVTATVSLDYGAAELTVRVDDDGQATPDTAAPPGVGLTGMRERVSALGGRLHTGPRPQGGFTVRTTIPLTALADSVDEA